MIVSTRASRSEPGGGTLYTGTAPGGVGGGWEVSTPDGVTSVLIALTPVWEAARRGP